MDLVFATATQLSQMIRNREVSASEVLAAYVRQIEKYNDKFNAIATYNFERAKKRATEADEALARGENWGVLHGVPVTIKDTLETAGIVTTAGYTPLKNYLPDRDATTVVRLKAAGAIVIAKTNTPQLAGDYQTNNPLFGRTNNPWNIERTVGGSSGGSACAISAGFSPLDLGSDIAGSVRLPAHYCGVCGFMPTDRRVPTTGHVPELPNQPKTIRHLLRIGVLARSVADLQLCFNLIAGADIEQPEIPPVPVVSPPEKTLSRLKIAWSYGYDLLPVSKDTRSAIKSFITLLDDANCQLTECNPIDLDWEEVLAYYGAFSSLELFASGSWKNLFDGLQFGIKTEFLARTQTSFKSGTPLTQKSHLSFPPSLANYNALLTERDRITATMDRFMARWDAWICPVALSPAFLHCDTGQSIEVDGVKFPYLLACGGYTMPLNFTGHPVVVIPIGLSRSRLPVGVQIVGQRWQDEALLAVAERIAEIVDKLPQPFALE